MLLFRLLKAKEVVFAIFLGLAMALTPAQVNAQDFAEAPEMEEEAPAGTLMAAPPVVKPMKGAGAQTGADGYRSPTLVPGTMAPAVKPAAAKMPMQVKAPVAADEAATQAEPGAYIVQPGETAPIIAKKLWGSSKRWRELMEYNGIKDANALRVGQKLNVPGEATGVPSRTQSAQAVKPAFQIAEPEAQHTPAESSHARVAPAKSAPAAHASNTHPARENTTRSVVAKAPVVKTHVAQTKTSISADVEDADAGYYNQAGGSYTVQRGDTMAKIAKKTLGSTKRWREIARANKGMNANKLIVGQTIIIPGQATANSDPEDPSGPAVTASPLSFDANAGVPTTGPIEPPPAAPPPLAYQGGQQGAMAMAAPMPPMGAGQPYQNFEPPPAPPPVMSGVEVPPPSGPGDMRGSTQNLYREERYRIPDELKPTDYTPYFVNAQGYHGLFNTECAWYPYIRTWHLGLGFRYDNYRDYEGSRNSVAGHQWTMPLSVLYTGRRFMGGFTVPFQSWQLRPNGSTQPNVGMTSVADPELRFGYQIWKNFEGTHAVSLHVAGRFSSDNYHVPFWAFDGKNFFNGKTRMGAKVGPANATRGSWGEFGGAYSGKLNERWNSHINLSAAHDSDDGLTRYTYRTTLDYRVNQHFTLMGELDGTSWDMSGARSGSNIDFTPGMAWFNDRWEGYMGFPVAIQSDWGVGHDYGINLGVTARWE